VRYVTVRIGAFRGATLAAMAYRTAVVGRIVADLGMLCAHATARHALFARRHADMAGDAPVGGAKPRYRDLPEMHIQRPVLGRRRTLYLAPLTEDVLFEQRHH
jgi:hypothetical protein